MERLDYNLCLIVEYFKLLWESDSAHVCKTKNNMLKIVKTTFYRKKMNIFHVSKDKFSEKCRLDLGVTKQFNCLSLLTRLPDEKLIRD